MGFSYLDVSYLGSLILLFGVSLHGCSSRAQPRPWPWTWGSSSQPALMIPCISMVFTVISLLSFLILLIYALPLFFSWWVLFIIFTKNQLLVSLIFFFVFLVFISFTSAPMFIISFLLITLSFACPFANSFRYYRLFENFPVSWGMLISLYNSLLKVFSLRPIDLDHSFSIFKISSLIFFTDTLVV